MKTRRDKATGGGDSRRSKRRQRRGQGTDDWFDDEYAAGPAGRRRQAEAAGRPEAAGRQEPAGDWADGRAADHRAGEAGRDGYPDASGYRGRDTGAVSGDGPGDGQPPVARRTATGWRVGDEEVSDLTSAMVLADLLAADLPASRPPAAALPPAPPAGREADGEQLDARQLQETVAQLEHALTVRVRVEQAIGVLAERHRLRPRQAFELLRSAARARGRRVLEVAGEVVESATNPLLRIPEELAKPPVARRRPRIARHSLGGD